MTPRWVSPPSTSLGLSKAISNLKAELGVRLFERGNRSVYLTDYGRAFLRRVKHILTELFSYRLGLLEFLSAQSDTWQKNPS